MLSLVQPLGWIFYKNLTSLRIGVNSFTTDNDFANESTRDNVTFLVDNNSRLAIVRSSLVVWNQFRTGTEGLNVAVVQKGCPMLSSQQPSVGLWWRYWWHPLCLPIYPDLDPFERQGFLVNSRANDQFKSSEVPSLVLTLLQVLGGGIKIAMTSCHLPSSLSIRRWVFCSWEELIRSLFNVSYPSIVGSFTSRSLTSHAQRDYSYVAT